MCLIAVGNKTDIMKLNINKAWQTNPDGAGIVIPRARPVVIKGIMHLKELYRTLKHVSDNELIAVHFRLATHGSVNRKNTHPFQLGKSSWLMHNGILNGLGSSGKDGESDSAELARILSRVNGQDRAKILSLLSGKYLLVAGNVYRAIGGFEKYKNCLVSNTYWDTDYRATYTPNTSITPKPWPWAESESKYRLNLTDYMAD